MMMSNELGERNTLIDEMKKMQAQYEQKLIEKDNLYKQDSIVRLQLGKRLEQVLMDKAEAEVLRFFPLLFFLTNNFSDRKKWSNFKKRSAIS